MKIFIFFLFFSSTIFSQSYNYDSFSKKRVYEKGAPFSYILKNFIDDVYSYTDFHYLFHTASDSIAHYISPHFGLGYYYNPGAFCDLWHYSLGKISQPLWGDDRDDYNSIIYPDSIRKLVENMEIYNKFPSGGFCEESSDPDGIYFSTIDDLPEFFDIDNDNYQSGPFDDYEKMSVTIFLNGWIIDRMYFIKYDDYWYLVFLNHCDCSA